MSFTRFFVADPGITWFRFGSVHAFKSNLKPVSVENSTLDSPTENNHTYNKEEIVRESVLSTAYEMNFFYKLHQFW